MAVNDSRDYTTTTPTKKKMKPSSSPSPPSKISSKLLRIRTASSSSHPPPSSCHDMRRGNHSDMSSPVSTPTKKSLTSSLGTGIMGQDGRVSFVASPKKQHDRSSNGNNHHNKTNGAISSSLSSATAAFFSSMHRPVASSSSFVSHPTVQPHATTTAACTASPSSTNVPSAQHTRTSGLRLAWSFLRVADLQMDQHDTWVTASSSLGSSEEGDNNNNNSNPNIISNGNEPNIDHVAVDPPPGVDVDPNERWIALTTDMDGSYAPLAPVAMDRLANFGLTTSLNEPMWVADPKTDRLLKRPMNSAGGIPSWMKATFKPGKVRLDGLDGPHDSEVLVWSGSFKHGLYGSDLPAIRAAGIINMSAKALMELLVDSQRVQEYNKLSLGRQDLITFDGDLHTAGPFGMSITKVMKSETKPPMIRKSLVFVSILHAKELVDGSGYLIVTRAVHQPEDQKSMANAIKSEILMGVNLIRKIDCSGGTGDNNCVDGIDLYANKCVLINVNHIRSPLVPMMVAKRIGVTSAVGFINDIRVLC